MTLTLLTTLILALPAAAHAGKRSDVAKHLNRALAGTPLAGTGYLLEQAGHKHGVSPYFMVAAAATESSLGRVPCSNNPKNIWGLASCTNSWPVPYFETWREAFHFYARFLAQRWPTASTPHHYYGYAACSSCWGDKTAWWMSRLFGVQATTRYGRPRQ
jgi:hypothetical protein